MQTYARATEDLDVVIGGRVTLLSRTSLQPGSAALPEQRQDILLACYPRVIAKVGQDQ